MYQFTDSGEIKRNQVGNKLYRRPPFTDPSIPIRDNEKPPCDSCPKIPKNIRRQFNTIKVYTPWQYASDLSFKNQLALQHWQICEALHWQVPRNVRNDPIVMRNARIINNVRQLLREQREANSSALLQIAMTRLMMSKDNE